MYVHCFLFRYSVSAQLIDYSNIMYKYNSVSIWGNWKIHVTLYWDFHFIVVLCSQAHSICDICPYSWNFVLFTLLPSFPLASKMNISEAHTRVCLFHFSTEIFILAYLEHLYKKFIVKSLNAIYRSKLNMSVINNNQPLCWLLPHWSYFRSIRILWVSAYMPSI